MSTRCLSIPSLMYGPKRKALSKYADSNLAIPHIQSTLSAFMRNVQNITANSGLSKMLHGRLVTVAVSPNETTQSETYTLLPELICGPAIVTSQDRLMDQFQYAMSDLFNKYPSMMTEVVVLGLHELYPFVDKQYFYRDHTALQTIWLCGALQHYFTNLDIIAHLQARIRQIGMLYIGEGISYLNGLMAVLNHVGCVDSLQKPTPGCLESGLEAVLFVNTMLERDSLQSCNSILPLYWATRVLDSTTRSYDVATPYCSNIVYGTYQRNYRYGDVKTFQFVLELDPSHDSKMTSTAPSDWWMYATWSYFRRLVDSNCSELHERKIVFPPEMRFQLLQQILSNLKVSSCRPLSDISDDDASTLQQFDMSHLIPKFVPKTRDDPVTLATLPCQWMMPQK